jgi:hypothetical protein
VRKWLFLFPLCAFFLSAPAPASEGYLGPQLLYGQFLGQNNAMILGGWILGGDSEWRAGAAGYTLISPVTTPSGALRFHYGGAMIYKIFPIAGSSLVFHVGTLLGGGMLSTPGASKPSFFWAVEPNMMLAFPIFGWMAVGISAGFRYVPPVTQSSIVYDELYGAMAGVSLIFGEI